MVHPAILVCLRYSLLLVLAGFGSQAFAHNLSDNNASFVAALNGPAIGPFLYLGAKHMLTGYDHLLYLLGVVFFLERARDVMVFVTLFAIGHSITLLVGVLLELNVSSWLIDGIIGLSVVYKAFENLGGFRHWRVSIEPKLAVFAFGLCHGLGLATKLQDLALSSKGLIVNLLSFNIGVEFGQALALFAAVGLLVLWRHQAAFWQQAVFANAAIMCAGFVLAGYHFLGWYLITHLALEI